MLEVILKDEKLIPMYQVIMNIKKRSDQLIYDTLIQGVLYACLIRFLLKCCPPHFHFKRNHYDLHTEFYHLIKLTSITERSKTIKNPSMMGLIDLY